jgi:3-hydroxyacyl-CoA dehydrogenase
MSVKIVLTTWITFNKEVLEKMSRQIRKVAVIGSGVMGSGIAGHLANVGISSLLLDIVPTQLNAEEEKKGLSLEHPAIRSRYANQAKQLMLKQKPSPIFVPEVLDLIETGNLEDDLHRLSEMDWIIEVIVENLAIKQSLYEKLEAVWKEGTIVSSNTSGISINQMVLGRSDSFKKHFLGTHFFNPPRYMKLLEIIPGEMTDPAITDYMTHFSEKILGKGVVMAKDTPNFIANRIGTFGLQITLKEMKKFGLRVDEVDELTGPHFGRPKSATFRTLDIVGLDTFVHVTRNVSQSVSDASEQKAFSVPEELQKMVDNGWIGEKAGQGFYKKVKGEGGKEILSLDLNTFEYVPRKRVQSASLEAAKLTKGQTEKLRTLVYGKDVYATFLWSVLKQVLVYSAERVGEIANSIVEIDNAMKWGFNWDLGPFETWDAIGLEKSAAKMKEEGTVVPAWVEELVASGQKSFYKKESSSLFYINKGEYSGIEETPEKISLAALKEQNRTILSNSGASLIDLGDGVACLEFHSPNNAIGEDIGQIILKSMDEVRQNYSGLVIGNQGKNFCVGANLMMLLMMAQEDDFDDIQWTVQRFQETLLKLKYFEKPVVAAPHAMTLGGGVEVCMPADYVQLGAETYYGLVEVGVGLIPGGGGVKEAVIRFTEDIADPNVDLQPFINRAFETIAMAKVSTSGEEAKKLGLIRKTDAISINRDFQLYDAKQKVLQLSEQGYKPRQEKKVRVVGEPGGAVMKLGAFSMKQGGYISEHDEKIAKKLAHVLSGGNVPANTWVTEKYLLELEREAFISLCGEPKTQQRMQYMLTKGKPLRN